MTKKLGIREALAQSEDRRTKVTLCRFCRWLNTLETDDRAAIVEALDSGEWQIKALHDKLVAFGWPGEYRSLVHHVKHQHQISAS